MGYMVSAHQWIKGLIEDINLQAVKHSTAAETATLTYAYLAHSLLNSLHRI